jgi:phosphoribosylanthranilate isomerase
MTRAEDLAVAIGLHVDALGFVFVPKSPRYVDPASAGTMRKMLPPTIKVVALFQDADARAVQAAIRVAQPDVLQFHGAETESFCAGFGLPYLKAVSMHQPRELAPLVQRYASAAALLLDSHPAGELGGTGKVFDWGAVPPVNKPLVLAGGLTPANVAAAIRALRPCAVDVSSGIERAPGVKDSEKMRAFAGAVRRIDQELSP